MSQLAPRSEYFPATPWTQLMQLRGSGVVADEALGAVCGLYWQPLCQHIRSKGFESHDAEDLTQDFLSKLVARGDFCQVDRSRGKLRSYLFTALGNFLANVWRDRKAAKRGGGAWHLSLDDAGLPHPDLVSTEAAPDAAFDRQWAMTLLENVLKELGDDFARQGRKETFELLSPALAWAGGDQDYALLGRQFEMTPGAVRVAVHRLRLRYRNTLFRHIAATVEREDQVEEEIRELMEVLRHHG